MSVALLLGLLFLQKVKLYQEIYIYPNENENHYKNLQCSGILEEERMDCHPEAKLSPYECMKRGCCWNSNTNNESAPFCFFGKNYGIYKVKSQQKTKHGISIRLELTNNKYLLDLIEEPLVEIEYKTFDQLRIKISDYMKKRYEVPLPLNQKWTYEYDINYEVSVVDYPFSLIIKRKSPESVIFDSRVAPLIFADQFLSISTALSGSFVYGIGGRWGHTYIPFEWNSYPLLNADHRPEVNTNGYGTHPFYIVSDQKSAYGILYYNSNPQEFVSQPSKRMTWRSLGGIFDIYIFMGPTTMDLMRQYTDLVGRSVMPPFWSLGFHICKYGYTSTEDVRDIVHKMKKAEIPQDAQWTDIDFMERTKQFTFSWDGFGDLPELNKELHNDSLYHVIIAEPHVFGESLNYLPNQNGIEMNAFVRDNTNTSLQKQKVWPGECHYVDFGSKNASKYWTFELERFHNLVKFDGLWIDMNDPSSFSQSCSFGRLNYPPYLLKNLFYPYLYTKTVCMDAIHTLGLHYNVHNAYATLEAFDTYEALRVILPNERPLIISRSSFVTHGSVSGTWSGDSISTYFDMRNSVADVIRSNLMGIPLTGGDICGFALPANEELCTRWYLVGAFYPFMRNHADHEDKTPFAFSHNMTQTVKKIIQERYKLLPFLYTLFYQSHVSGTPVIQPLFMRWNHDINSHMNDDQFLWGSAMLISPGFDNDNVVGYFPEGIWYDYWRNDEPIYSKGIYRTMKTPLDKINVHVYGGNIIPTQESELRTTMSRKTPFTLLAYVNSTECNGVVASGELFWDDGISFEINSYNLFEFTLNCVNDTYKLTSLGNISYNEPMALKSVEVNGVEQPKGQLTINGVETKYSYDSRIKLLVVDFAEVSLLSKLTMSWN